MGGVHVPHPTSSQTGLALKMRKNFIKKAFDTLTVHLYTNTCTHNTI